MSPQCSRPLAPEYDPAEHDVQIEEPVASMAVHALLVHSSIQNSVFAWRNVESGSPRIMIPTHHRQDTRKARTHAR